MTKDIKLFIGEMEVEFSTAPDILYNWTETDLSNPTLTKNGYSKTITIEGTPNNNKIFGHFWNLERYQNGTSNNGPGFNPTYRVPFALYVNGDVFEKGYVKLQNVKIVGNVTYYEIGLFGGLGSFLYNLSVDWNTGEKKTLADLRYFGNWAEEGHPETNEMDLGFTINKETVKEAWDDMRRAWTGGYYKWNHINFAPCYNGLNDKLNTDKAVINFNGLSNREMPASYYVNAHTFSSYTGYALATLPGAMSEWEMRDLRSWAQRPVIRTMSIINAICTKCNTKGKYDDGYEVVLDPDFFHSNNPYYVESFMTLPLLTSLEFSSDEEETILYTSAWTRIDKVGNVDYTYTFALPSATTKYGASVKMKFDLYLKVPGTTQANMYPAFTVVYQGGARRYQNALGIQAYSSDNILPGGNVLAVSNVEWLGYSAPAGQQWPCNSVTYESAVKEGVYTPIKESGVNSRQGYYTRYSDGIYKWNQPVELTFDLPVGSTCFKVNLHFAGLTDYKKKNANPCLVAPQPMVPGSALNWYKAEFEMQNANFPFSGRTVSIYYPSQNNFYSNRVITKQQLLGTDYSPADWLIGFCKMFGLYIHKDPNEDKIYIDTRNTFYRRNNVKDISHLIDHSKELTITPVAVDSGYYSMSDKPTESGAFKDYLEKYGKDYGIKIVSTGYEFDANTKELISSPFKSAVQVRDNSGYYFGIDGEGIPSVAYNGIDYTLWRSRTATQTNPQTAETYEYAVVQKKISTVCPPLDSEYPYFDLFDKPMFEDGDRKPIDGANVFLFVTDNIYPSVTAPYFLTDDLDVMARLNGSPCYILSTSSADTSGVQIGIPISEFPHFSRYSPAGNGLIMFSWDWGSPRQLYVPQLYIREENNLYYHSYQSYLKDLYDINTKVLTCYIKPDKIIKEDDLRNFYWFKNSIWRLNKVTDYNPTSNDVVKCEFVKVQDLENMSSVYIDPNSRFLTCTITPENMPWSGGTAVLEFTTNDGCGGCAEYMSPGLSIDWSGCGRDGMYNVTVSPNYSTSARTLEIEMLADNDGRTVTITQAANNSTFGVNPVSITNISSAGTDFDVTITVNNTIWTVDSMPVWVTHKYSGQTSGDTSMTITFHAATNRATARSGYINISALGWPTKSIYVSQRTARDIGM